MILRCLPTFPASSALAALLGALLLCTQVARAEGPAFSPAEVAGTYRIEGWQGLEARGMYHFFYLHPGGRFYLAGEWPGSETSRFGGTWTLEHARLHLAGQADVNTSQGHWTVPYLRTFTLARAGGTIRLAPLPEKNRFGLMGWPNAFERFSAEPAVNLPGGALPSDPAQLVRLSETLSPAK